MNALSELEMRLESRPPAMSRSRSLPAVSVAEKQDTRPPEFERYIAAIYSLAFIAMLMLGMAGYASIRALTSTNGQQHISRGVANS